MVKTRQTCRICGGPLRDIFDLGLFPIVGYDDSIKRNVPLCLTRCDSSNNESSCGLVQLRHTVSPYLLYEQYFYVSGVNENMIRHLHEVADRTIEISGVSYNDTIIDVGCNDGSSLKYYESLGFTNLAGFDPARNISQVKSENITIIHDYFKPTTDIPEAKLISSIAMFYDLEYPHEFVRTILSHLACDGVWMLELAYLPDILELNTFDTICHEHLEYYCLATLEYLFHCHGLEIIDAYINNVNGGSIQLYVSRNGIKKIGNDAYDRIRAIKIREFEMKLDTDEPYVEFVSRVKNNGEQLRLFLMEEKSNGKKIYCYGASTKGFTLLKYYNIDNSIIEACSDRNKMKWGSIMRGSNIPIVSELEAREAKPDYFLVLPWHFIDAFIERENDFLRNGGKFVVPIPEFKVISYG